MQSAIEDAAEKANLFAVDDLRDWPFSHGENDNYHNKCHSCGGGYRGHKNSLVCYACHKAAKRWWAGLTDKERVTETEKRYAEINRVMAKLFKKNTPAEKTES